MKKIAISLLLLLLISMGMIYLYIIPSMKKEIASHLSNLNFSDVHTEGTSFKPNGISIDKIYLDKDKFNNAEDIKINVFWPTYLFNKKIKSLSVQKLTLITVTDNFQNLFLAKRNIQKLLSQKSIADNINIEYISWSTQLPNQDIRFLGSVKVQKKDENRIVKATLAANQYEMAFESVWKGTIDKDKKLSLNADIQQLKVNYGPLNINRGTGWISLNHAVNDSTISGQLDAGSGAIYKIPANNISLIIGQEDDYFPVLFRAEASGIEGVNISLDAHYSRTLEKQKFDTHLKIENLSDFATYLKALKIVKHSTTAKINNLNLSANYMPEKRFADGPYPFDITINDSTGKISEGTILTYPDSLDIRGTISTKKAAMSVIKSFIKINEENITDNTIRIDGNLKETLKK